MIIEKVLDFLNAHGEKILFAIIFLALGYVLIKVFLRVSKKAMNKRGVEANSSNFIISIAKFTLYVLLVCTVLQIIGVPVTTIIAALSVVGIAVGLAIQNSLANVAGGFIIIFTQPFQKGDYILLDDVEGTVIQTGILQTKIATLDNRIIFIPTSQITDNNLTNFTVSGTRRIMLEISIGYEDDFRKAITLIEEIVKNDPLILEESEEQQHFIRMIEHGDSAIILAVRVWSTSENYINARSGLLEQIKDAFDQNSISIPFPQLDVSIKK